MNPKEKARELYTKFYWKTYISHEEAKQCALICVDEILNTEVYKLYPSTLKNEINYWQKVKKEIEKL